MCRCSRYSILINEPSSKNFGKSIRSKGKRNSKIFHCDILNLLKVNQFCQKFHVISYNSNCNLKSTRMIRKVCLRIKYSLKTSFTNKRRMKKQRKNTLPLRNIGVLVLFYCKTNKSNISAFHKQSATMLIE